MKVVDRTAGEASQLKVDVISSGVRDCHQRTGSGSKLQREERVSHPHSSTVPEVLWIVSWGGRVAMVMTSVGTSRS